MTGPRHSHAQNKRADMTQSGKDDGGRTKMPSMLNEALEWLDRAEQARGGAGQLTDPGARKAVLELGLRVRCSTLSIRGLPAKTPQSQVRRRLAAGGKRIRTLSPTRDAL